MSRSLQSRLLLSTTCLTTVVLGLLGLGIYILTRHALLTSFDTALVAQARSLAALVEQAADAVSVEYDPHELPEFAGGRRPQYFQMWLDDGSVLARSPSLGQRDLEHTAAGREPITWATILPSGRRGRAAEIRFAPRSESGHPSTPPQKDVHLVVARDAGELGETLERLRWLLVGACATAIVLCDGALVFAVRRSVHPVSELSRAIGLVDGNDLDRSFETRGLPAELVPIAEKLNGLLQRIGEALRRERAFAADAAHELRTPLAGLQATLEVCRSRPRERQAYEAAVDQCLAIVGPMQQMVEQLMLLSRAESGQLPVTMRPLDLSGLVPECWEAFQGRSHQRGLRVNLDLAPDCRAASDRDKLCIVLRNLFDNAVTYVDSGGAIEIAVRGQEQLVTLMVRNTGSQIAAQDAPRVLERFWQGDAARASTGVHSGLGLSLCARLVHLLGGTISVESEAGGWFTVVVTIPRQDHSKRKASMGSRREAFQAG